MTKRIRLRFPLIIASTMLFAPLAYAQVIQNEIQTLLADDAEAADRLGISVAIDSDTAVISAYGEDDSGASSNGAAYVFTRSAGNWMQLHYVQFSRTCTS